MGIGVHSLQFVYEKYKGEHNLQADGHTLKAILMEAAFVFDPVAHSTYANVSANELATANGYTAGGVALTGVALTRDDVNKNALVDCNNPEWLAAGGSIGGADACIVYNDTHASKTIVCCIPFSDTRIAPDGEVMEVKFPNGLSYAKIIIPE